MAPLGHACHVTCNAYVVHLEGILLLGAVVFFICADMAHQSFFSHFTMLDLLTCGGVNVIVLLPMESDRVPVSVQVLNVCVSSTSELAGTVVIVSDGNHYFPVTLVKCLQDLVHCGDVEPGVIVLLNNYITQNLSCEKLVVICLALSVIGFNEATIGTPSEYICPAIVSDEGTKIVTLDSSELCPHCEQKPCEWSVYGPTVVDSVRATHGTMSRSVLGSETCLKNKSCQHDVFTVTTLHLHEVFLFLDMAHTNSITCFIFYFNS